MALSKESIRKLRAVKAAILAEPELYNQDVGFWDGDHLVPACLLVWAVWLHNPSPKEFRAAYERKERRKLNTHRRPNYFGDNSRTSKLPFRRVCYGQARKQTSRLQRWSVH